MFVTRAPYSDATLNDYAPLIGPNAVQRIRERAAPLRGARLLHVNATAVGGGVAEMLLSLVPLMRDAGIAADWYVPRLPEAFYQVTKTFHNALQGQPVRWSERLMATYRTGNAAAAKRLARHVGAYDVVVIHDPQPLALRAYLSGKARWIWRCHIDLTAPHARAWNALAPFLDPYDLAIFSTPEYIPPGLTTPVATALPCIDPFRPKNAPLRRASVAPILRQYGIDPQRPYLLQVSRFDPWKDPLGVLEVYRRVKTHHPRMQLVYMASMAADDPEGATVYRRMRRAAAGDPDVHLLALDVPLDRVSDNAREVNALQRGASIVLQKSLREGFGLTVAEAMWKRRAVVAGNVGGIRYQVRDGWNGFLVASVDECAERVLLLLEQAHDARRFGRRGRDTVRRNFLFPRLLDQYIGWMTAWRNTGEGTGAGQAVAA
ncbi:MAG: glycosyltransferase [Longimicrobiales bacterium]